MIKPDGSAYKYDYSKADKPIVPLENQPVSGGVVANREAYLKAHGKEVPVPVQKIGNQKAGPAGSSGVIRKGVLQEKTAKAAPKKKAATAGDVRSALGSGNINIEEAADLNPKGLSSPIKKGKKK